MFHVRPAKLEDSTSIIDFQVKMAWETEAIRLDRKTIEAGVTSVFKNPEKATYYVGVSNDQVVSSMMITTEWSDWRNKTVWWLQSVYVLPDFRGQGMFRQMFNYINKLIDQKPEVAGLRLYVDASNKNALKTYAAVGMDVDHYQVCEKMEDY